MVVTHSQELATNQAEAQHTLVNVLRHPTDQPRSSVKLATLPHERRMKSSNEDQVFVKRITRLRSSQQGSETTIRTTVATLQADVFKSIVSRMQQSGISTTDLDPRYFNWCLPQVEDRDLWQSILDDTLFVAPAELDQVLDLREVSQTYDAEPTNVTSYYLRTFGFLVHELLDVLDKLAQDGLMSISKITSWIERLKHADPLETVYVRYVGMTEYAPWFRHMHDLTAQPGSFTIRFIQTTLLHYPDIIRNVIVQQFASASITISVDQSVLDTREQALISLLDVGALNSEPGGRFMHKPTTKDEDMFAPLATKVRSLLPARTTIASASMIIDIEKLVNRIQTYANANPLITGTSVYSFTRHLQDYVTDGMTPAPLMNGMTAFVTIGSDTPLDVFRSPETFMLGHTKAAALVTTIIKHFDLWERGLGSLDETLISQLQSDHHVPFVDLFPWPKTSDESLDQAMRFMRDYFQIVNPLVALTYGEKVASVALGSFNHVFGLSSELLNVVGTLSLSNFARSSVGSHSRDQGYIVVIPSFHPGIVVYKGAASDLARAIFTMTAMKGWLAMHEALKRSSSTSSKKVICEEIIAAVEAKCGPNTPFDQRFKKLKRDYKAKVAESRRSNISRAERASRESAVRAAAKGLSAQRRTDRTSVSVADRDAKAALKVKYVIYSGPKGVMMVSPTTVWSQARKELDMVLHCGFSSTAPATDARHQEAVELYDIHMASLQQSQAVQGDKSQFLEYVVSSRVPQGGNFYLSVVSTDDAVKDIPNLIRCFMSDSIRDPYDAKWARRFNNTAQSEALGNLITWTKNTYATAAEKSTTTEVFNNAFDEHLKQRDPSVYDLIGKRKSSAQPGIVSTQIFSTTDDLNGTQITIKSHWKNYDATAVGYSVSWMTLDGHVRTMDGLPLPRTVMPSKDTEKRFIFFVPEGIDIRDGEGNSIKPQHEVKGKRQKGTTQKPLYPTLSVSALVFSLQSHPHGSDFLELWEQQTGLSIDDALNTASGQQAPPQIEPGEAVIPASYYSSGSSRALPPVSSWGKKAKSAAHDLLPVYPGDSMWLLHKFLEDAYPQGGEVYFSNPAEDWSGNDVWIKLAAFLQQALYSKHPFIREIRSLTEMVRNGGTDAKKVTSNLKSVIAVLCDTTAPQKSGTMRVKTGPNPGKVVGFLKLFISSSAPIGALAAVADPVVVHTSSVPVETNKGEVISKVEAEDGDEGEEGEEEQTGVSRSSKKRGFDDDSDDAEQQSRSVKSRL